MKVFVSIPAYNEEKSIGTVIESVKKVMQKTRYDYGILVVDDGSTDATAKLARKFGAVVYSHPRNYGLAEVFRTEIEKCLEHKADVIVHIDADGQYRATEILKLLKEIEDGNDIVLGSRFLGHIEQMPIVKRLGNMAFSSIISSITRTKITDGQTGFRAFTRKVAEKVNIRSNHTYTQEQIIRAVKQKFRVKEVPVFFDKRKDGKSRLISNPLGYAVRAWINIIRIYRDYEPLKFFGMIGGIVLGFGIALGIYLVYRFLAIGLVGRTPTVILTLLLITLGVQIILFGFLADMEKSK
ncbi:glycosyltransferase family 2 protein [Candidatus Woesearchaeota archaeon]|nr:glycosyltransferase family 2 protein [Candidatus Woesearchaeota archaeon]